MVDGLTQPCKGGSHSYLPEKRKNLDLHSMVSVLESNGYNIVMDLDLMLIFKKDIEVTLYPSGRIIFKTLENDVADRELALLRELLPAIVE